MACDTIFALSSGRPPAAISVIRISGADAHATGARLAGNLPPAREAAVRELRSEDGQLLDQALLLRFDSPASATGEDVVELQCHGGRAVVDAILGELSKFDGLRAAQPGEFTRRAFENGRIDLTEAEGLADLLEAETESQRRSALLMAEGGLRKQVETWRQQLIDLSARAEVAIDYVDEASVDTDPTLTHGCGLLAARLRDWLDRPRAERLKDGVTVVIAGPPNAGKSSLLNAIVGYERAIVTNIAGTTRDHIEVPVAIAGLPIRLSDTAGLRTAEEQVERIGVERARALVEGADVVLWLGEPDHAPHRPCVIRVHAKSDLPARRRAPAGSIAVSSSTGEGLGELLSRVSELATSLFPAEGESALNARQAGCLADAAEALKLESCRGDPVLIAESLRVARSAFDRLTGRAGIEELLDALFGRFCLGK